MDFGPTARSGKDLQATAGEGGSFFHAEESEAGAADGAVANFADVKADAIVFDSEVELLVFATKLDLDAAGAGVASDVRECFLPNAETFSFNDGLESFLEGFGAEGAVDFGGGCRTVCVPAEGGFQSEVIQHGRPEVEGKVSDLILDLLDSLNAFDQVFFHCRGLGFFECALEVHLGNSQGLADFVMKFTSDLAALRFLDFDETMGEDLEFVASSLLFDFTLFERLGHLVEGEGEFAEFVAAVWETGTRVQIATGELAAGLGEHTNGAHDE